MKNLLILILSLGVIFLYLQVESHSNQVDSKYTGAIDREILILDTVYMELNIPYSTKEETVQILETIDLISSIKYQGNEEEIVTQIHESFLKLLTDYEYFVSFPQWDMKFDNTTKIK